MLAIALEQKKANKMGAQGISGKSQWSLGLGPRPHEGGSKVKTLKMGWKRRAGCLGLVSGAVGSHWRL